jgi:acetyl-CoA C-acetyltransferase
MREVCMVGVGFSPWGEVWRHSLRSLYVEAAQAAIRDAGVDHVDSIYVGCMTGGLFVGQEHLGPLVADYLGMRGVPAAHVESACASGGMAVRQAFLEVASGVSEIVLAGGVEKMTDCTGDAATAALATAADQEYEVFNGATFPGLYAMMAQAHMHRYGTSRDVLSAVAVKNHHNGSLNPVAQYQFEVSMEQVSNSVLVADPLRVLDCSGITDGAAAVIVTSLDVAKSLGRPYVRVTGSAVATDTIALAQRSDFTSIPSARLAVQRALAMARRELKEIRFAEVHDCFTIAEIMILESIGFYKPSAAGPATLAGETALDGRLPINPSGGLKAKGHPVGATGVAQVAEGFKQLTGRAESGRQIKGQPNIGLCHNMGGSGASSVVHILEAGQ